jgi:hypothetical protein
MILTPEPSKSERLRVATTSQLAAKLEANGIVKRG